MLGSPNYLPPEQAEARHQDIGPASDVYSLGAVLYCLITGRAPFQAASVADTLRQVSTTEPVAPRLLNPGIPKDLETICLKCLEKEIDRRYASAQELADELGRFLRGEPIQARPVGAGERVWRWCKRKPLVAGLTAGLTLVFLLGFAGVTWQWRRAQAEARRTEAAVTRLEIGRADLLFGNERAADALAYLARVLRREPDNRVAAERVLSALSHRNFCVPVLGLHHDSIVTSARFSADGQWLVTASKDKTARVWDGRTGAPRFAPLRHADEVLDAQFSPDGKWVATAGKDNVARIWDATTGRPAGPPLQHTGAVRRAEFSPDSTRVVTASEDGTARVWSVATGQPVTPPLRHRQMVYSARFSRDGLWVATASWDETAAIWDARTGGARIRPIRLENRGYCAEFSPDGEHLVAGGSVSWAEVWAIPTTEKVARANHAGYCVQSGSFSPDGRRLLTASDDRAAHLWDVPSGSPIGVPMKHDSQVFSAEFGPEGERVLTASQDGTARLWDARTGEALTEPLRHEASVTAAHFSPDGQRVVTVSETSAAWVLELRQAQPLTPVLLHQLAIRTVRFSPSGQLLLTASYDKTARLWDWQTSRLLVETSPAARYLSGAEFSPDGQRFVTTCLDGATAVFDAQSGRPLFDLLQHGARLPDKERRRVQMARFSRDGQRLVTASWDGTARVWDALNGDPVTEPLEHEDRVNTVELSPDGRWIATSSDDGTAQVWDARTGRMRFTFRHDSLVNQVHWSSDGQRVVTASADRTARVWEVRTGLLLLSLRHEDDVRDALFSPDGQRLATRARNTARVWRAASGQPLTNPVKHDSQVNCLCWSPDQKHIVSGCDDGTIQLWDANTGQWLSEPLRQNAGVICVEFSPDGRWIATGTRAGLGHLIEVIPVPATAPPWLAELTEAMAGQRFNEQNESETVVVETLFQLRQRVPQTSPKDPLRSWAQWFFAPTATRHLSPSSEVTVPDYVEGIVRRYLQEPDTPVTYSSVRAAVMLAPTNGAALACLAANLWTQKPEEHPRRTNESTWLIRRALELAPDAAEVWQARGDLAGQQGQFSEALSFHRAALERQPTNNSYLWERTGQLLVQTNRLDEAVRCFQEALRWQPSSTSVERKHRIDLLQQLTLALVAQDRWSEAAAFGQAIELDSTNPLDWRHQAALLAMAGDQAGYEALCTNIVARFRGTTAPKTAERLARACLLRPASGEALAIAGRWIDLALTVQASPYMLQSYQLTKSLAEYRMGRFASASDWMQKALSRPILTSADEPDDTRVISAQALLAMVNHQLGKSEEARAALAKADALHGTGLLRPVYDQKWHDRVVALILLREARSTLGDTKAADSLRSR